MLPVFSEYLSMLASFGVDLSMYDENKLWVDRLIIRGFDGGGKEHKICRLKVTDELEYEFKFYEKVPRNEKLITWDELYKLNENKILEREKESLEIIQDFIIKYPGYKYICLTSMGKDSKLVDYLLTKAGVYYKSIFNNSTLDSSDVYKEVKSHPEITIVNPIDKWGKKGFYNLVKEWGTPTRFARWCCSFFKERPTIQYFEGIDNILFFSGIRKSESPNRSKYQIEERNVMWTNETWKEILPILYWSDIELWLYTIHNNIPINSKYKKGYNRVGCHIACPFYKKTNWILDKYWYPSGFNRWRNILKNDFINGEKWTRINCTEQEYYLNWNGGVLREAPTEEVIKEFAEHKGIEDLELARKYFNKKCVICGKNVVKKNEVAMNLKMFGRNISKFKCKKCLMKELNWTKEDWNNSVDKFQQEGCVLF